MIDEARKIIEAATDTRRGYFDPDAVDALADLAEKALDVVMYARNLEYALENYGVKDEEWVPKLREALRAALKKGGF